MGTGRTPGTYAVRNDRGDLTLPKDTPRLRHSTNKRAAVAPRAALVLIIARLFSAMWAAVGVSETDMTVTDAAEKVLAAATVAVVNSKRASADKVALLEEVSRPLWSDGAMAGMG